MSITSITIQENEFLKDCHQFPVNAGLNIITSKNGGGKTKLLEYIYKNYPKVRKISTSVQHFKCFEEIDKYEKMPSKDIRPPESRQFIDEYKAITYLPRNAKIVQQCNEFFENLKMDIRLHNVSVVELYRLLFKHTKVDTKKPLKLSELSVGEKTAFILWLITQQEQKPSVLLLDEFDSTINEDVLDKFYEILLILSKEMQIFITTNRWKDLASLNGKEYTKYRINDGRITNEFPLSILK